MDKHFELYTGTRNIAFDIPEKNFLYFAEHPHPVITKTEDEIIRDAVAHPYGKASLANVPLGAKVVIIVDDATRMTPVKKILPYIMEELEKRTTDITFVTAPGTHRPMTPEELDFKIGNEWLKKYPLVNIDYTKKEDYRYIGDTSESGIPVYIHHSVLDADYKIAIGNIGPHNQAGWSGGAKMIQPGVSGKETTQQTHYKGALLKLEDIFCNLDNQMRREIDEVGAKVGLDYIANTVLDMDFNVLGLFCGDFIEAHRAGVKMADKLLRPEIPALADIVIVSAFPSYVDCWQGFKPIGFAMKGIKKDGTFIYLIDAPEGICGDSPAHLPTVKKYLGRSVEEIKAAVDAGEVTDLVGIINPLNYAEVYAKTKSIFCVSEGLSEEECKLLQFEPCKDINEAIEKALKVQGPDAKIGVIPFGGETVVKVKEG